MPDRITRPQGLGLTFSPGRAVGSPYGNAGAAMANAAKILANTPDKTSVGLAKLAEGIKGIGSGIRQYQDDQQQAGLRRVLQGGDYNAPSVWDRITATMGHVADGTLGQHAGERQAIRPTPMDRNPQNIVIGENGRLKYDPTAGSKAAYDAEKLKQIQADNARAARDDARSSQPSRTFRNGKPVDSGAGTDPLPKKDGNNPTNEPSNPPGLFPKPPGTNSVLRNDTAGAIPVPTAPQAPGPVDPTTMTATASPLAEPMQTEPIQPEAGRFDYTQTATNPAALNEAVTPGGDFNYAGRSPMADMPGPGEIYNAFDQPVDWGNSGIADYMGPAAFDFTPSEGSYDSSQGLYAGADYSSPMSDQSMPTEAVPDISLPEGGGMYG